jgi:excisionase family DNA binding protein
MPDTLQPKRFLTIEEFCNETRISRTTLHRHMKHGLIPYAKLGHRVLLPASLLDRLEETAQGKSI